MEISMMDTTDRLVYFMLAMRAAFDCGVDGDGVDGVGCDDAGDGCGDGCVCGVGDGILGDFSG